jgi:hypothetical protein
MSADWYFLRRGWFGKRRSVGPISEVEFCTFIRRGVIDPETMISSTSKTHGHWHRLREIDCAMQLYQATHPGSSPPRNQAGS